MTVVRGAGPALSRRPASANPPPSVSPDLINATASAYIGAARDLAALAVPGNSPASRGVSRGEPVGYDPGPGAIGGGGGGVIAQSPMGGWETEEVLELTELFEERGATQHRSVGGRGSAAGARPAGRPVTPRSARGRASGSPRLPVVM